MKAEVSNLKIILEENEIIDFWNIVMFAKDLHNERLKNGQSCMSVSELKLANSLIELTDKIK